MPIASVSNWKIAKHLAKLYDLFALFLAFIVATFLVHSSVTTLTMAEFLGLKITLGNGLLFGLLLLAWHSLFILCGLYESKRLTPVLKVIYDVCMATFSAALFLLVAAKMLHIKMVNTIFVFYVWGICTVCMVSVRLASRWLLKVLRKRGRNRRFLLIIGTNERAMEFADRIQGRQELGHSVVGFVDDDWGRIGVFEASGHSRCCTFSGLAEFLRHNVVDEAAIYLPLRSFYEHAAQLVSLCEHHGILVRTDTQVFKLRGCDASLLEFDEDAEGIPRPGSVPLAPAIAKRFIDFMGSLLLLLLLSPLLLVVSLLIKFSSPGPILFRQRRVGVNKRLFTMYKFRTMVADAEKIQDQLLSRNEMTGPAFKIKEDPRITPLGRILRKTSIDELPQLFNVLTGEMSLVGPRAMSLRDYRLFDQDWHCRRFSVKPGITCLWQILGRSSIPFEQWMELDLQYIDKWSLWLDLKILARTVPAVIRGTGAT